MVCPVTHEHGLPIRLKGMVLKHQGWGRWLRTPHNKRPICYKMLHWASRNRKWAQDLEHGMLGILGSPKTVASELANYKLYLVAVQEVTWHKGSNVSMDNYTFFYRNGNTNIVFVIHKGIRSAVKMVEFS
jgi:hypothetical protein